MKSNNNNNGRVSANNANDNMIAGEMPFLSFNLAVRNCLEIGTYTGQKGQPIKAFFIGHPDGVPVVLDREAVAKSAITAFAEIMKGTYEVLDVNLHQREFDREASFDAGVAVKWNTRRNQWESMDWDGRRLQFGAKLPMGRKNKHDNLRRLANGERLVIPFLAHNWLDKWVNIEAYALFFIGMMDMSVKDAREKSRKALEEDAALRQADAEGYAASKEAKNGGENVAQTTKELLFNAITGDVLKSTHLEVIDMMKLEGRYSFYVYRTPKGAEFNFEKPWTVQSFDATVPFQVKWFLSRLGDTADYAIALNPKGAAKELVFKKELQTA